jgi:alpha-L-arabinofuranosidase
MFAGNVGDKVLPVTASASGLYYSATADGRTGRIYLKIVNAAAQAVTAQLAFTGRTAGTAGIEVLAGPDPTVGNTLADPDAIVPSRSALQGANGVFGYQVPANSLTVVTLPGK